MPEALLIGAVSARIHPSLHAIRGYELQELVPGVRRDACDRRRHSAPHVGRPRLMERLRRTGLSIAAMCASVALVRQGWFALKRRAVQDFPSPPARSPGR